MNAEFDVALLDALLYKIEKDTDPKLDDSDWLLVIEALEYYKESMV